MRTKYIIVGVSALALLGGSAAYAAIPDSDDGEYHSCVANSGFSGLRPVYMIDKEGGSNCPSGYTEKVWNQTGPQGPAGPEGPQGPAGQQSIPGSGQVYFNGTNSTIQPGERLEVFNYCGGDGEYSLSGGGSAGHSASASGIPAGENLNIVESLYVFRQSDSRAGWKITLEAPSTNSAALDVFTFVSCLRFDAV